MITGHTHLPCNGVRRDRSEVTNHLVDRTALTPDPAITAVLHGVALDPAATYYVTVNSFLADGGDNFGTLATVTGPRIDGGSDLEALVNYLGTFSPVAPPDTDRVNELN